MINRKIREYIKENNSPKDEIEIMPNYNNYFLILLMQEQLTKHKKRNQLFYLESNTPKVIRGLASKLMIPKFKKITNYLNDAKITITSNKIENCFLKTFQTHQKII